MKGIFPFEYLNRFHRFNETSLPNQELFYNTLKNFNVKDQDYEHAINVWNKFNLKKFGDYLFKIRCFITS